MPAVPPSERGIVNPVQLAESKPIMIGEIPLTRDQFARVIFKKPESPLEIEASKIFQRKIAVLEVQFREDAGMDVPGDLRDRAEGK